MAYTAPTLANPKNPPDVQAGLIRMGVQGASPDSNIQTMALSQLSPGTVVKGAVTGKTAGGQGLAPVDTQIQAYTAPKPGAAPTTPARYNADGTVNTGANSNSSAPGFTNTSNASGNTGASGTTNPSLAGILSADEYKAKYGAKAVDEAGIREQIRQQNQARIDAINGVYNDMVSRQAVTNEGNQGSTRAINARSGLIGSDFGAANDANQRAAGDQAIKAINTEREARITSVLAEVNKLADDKIAAERAQAQGDADKYNTYLEKAQTSAKEMAKSLGSSGLSFEQLKEKDPNALQTILKNTGFSEMELALQMNAAKKTAEKIDWKVDVKGNHVLISGVNPLTGQLEYHTQELPPEAAGSDVKVIEGELWSVSSDGKTATKLGGPGLQDKLPASAQEYEYAKKNGYKGTYEEYQNLDANRKARITNPSGLDSVTASRVDKVSSKFESLPIVQGYNKVQEAVQAVKEFSVNPSSTNDQALIYAFAKAMDPTSSVREGEYATVQKYAQSFATKLGFDVNRLFAEDPQFLTDAARKSIVDTINSKFKVNEAQYKNVVKEYGRNINRITGQTDGESYLTDYGSAFDQPTGITDTAPTPDEISVLRTEMPGLSEEDAIKMLGKTEPLSMGENGSNGLGELSAKFESSGNPGSIGHDNTGGWSYGTYQLAHDNAKKFVEQSPYAREFQGIPFNSQAFKSKWQEIAKNDPNGFEQAQHDFIQQTHFEPQANKLAKIGVDLNQMSPILKDVIWSTVVQHGPMTNIIANAIKSLGKSASEADLIKKIYAMRWSGGMNFARSTSDVRKSVYNRFFGKDGEMKTALDKLKSTA